MADMRRVVFIGSHLGYPMDTTPLGGGAMVGLQLVRHWARQFSSPPLTVVGSGEVTPAAGIKYVQLPKGVAPDLVKASEFGYAQFCRTFERETTAWLLSNKTEFPPGKTLLLINDISESPDLDRLRREGYAIASIWHVDVVEFFNRIYLGGLLAPERLTRAYERLERNGLVRLVPDVLRLVFGKQSQAVRRSSLLILPSRQMAETIRRCYPESGRNMLILPWGGWRAEDADESDAREERRLRTHYQLKDGTLVLMTLSRISPEKGIHYLLEALLELERDGFLEGKDICLFVCGEPAFMKGEAYGRKVRGCAEKLAGVRVFFPGYLPSRLKRAYFRLSDLFVSASVHESYGLTLVEAMGAGLPVLASDHYGVEEILKPAYGVSVSYSPARLRARNLAAALKDLLADRDRLKRMGARAGSAARGMAFEDSARRLWDAVMEMGRAEAMR